MSRLAGSMTDSPTAGNIAADQFPNRPGEWQIRESSSGDRRLSFGCPLRPGEACGVFVKPHSYEAKHGSPAWTWDGNATAPTLSPSINCINEPPRSYGCGWHGHLSEGVFK